QFFATVEKVILVLFLELRSDRTRPKNPAKSEYFQTVIFSLPGCLRCEKRPWRTHARVYESASLPKLAPGRGQRSGFSSAANGASVTPRAMIVRSSTWGYHLCLSLKRPLQQRRCHWRRSLPPGSPRPRTCRSRPSRRRL